MLLESQTYEPAVGEAKWFEYLREQDNILNGLVPKNSILISNTVECEETELEQNVKDVVKSYDVYTMIRKAERELLSDGFNILSEQQKSKLEIITLTNLAMFY